MSSEILDCKTAFKVRWTRTSRGQRCPVLVHHGGDGDEVDGDLLVMPTQQRDLTTYTP
jgi:hypothetical protein